MPFKQNSMTQAEVKQIITGSEWESIAVELRPSKDRQNPGNIQPLYMYRTFTFTQDDTFTCAAVNYADAGGKVPLVSIAIKGHNVWQGPHPVKEGAYSLDYVADELYEITPLHAGFAAAANSIPVDGLSKWEVNVPQDVKGKAFPLFGLIEGQIYVDYDLVYVLNDLLFMGSKHVDGRAFDTAANRPTNLQVPLRKKTT